MYKVLNKLITYEMVKFNISLNLIHVKTDLFLCLTFLSLASTVHTFNRHSIFRLVPTSLV